MHEMAKMTKKELLRRRKEFVNSILDISHLEGETVQVVADGDPNSINEFPTGLSYLDIVENAKKLSVDPPIYINPGRTKLREFKFSTLETYKLQIPLGVRMYSKLVRFINGERVRRLFGVRWPWV